MFLLQPLEDAITIYILLRTIDPWYCNGCGSQDLGCGMPTSVDCRAPEQVSEAVNMTKDSSNKLFVLESVESLKQVTDSSNSVQVCALKGDISYTVRTETSLEFSRDRILTVGVVICVKGESWPI